MFLTLTLTFFLYTVPLPPLLKWQSMDLHDTSFTMWPSNSIEHEYFGKTLYIRWLKLTGQLNRITYSLYFPGCSVCGDDNSQYYEETGMCYKVVAEEKTWQEASQACIFKGGQLAMPKTASINRILTEIIRKYLDRWQDFWFGLWYNNDGKIQ